MKTGFTDESRVRIGGIHAVKDKQTLSNPFSIFLPVSLLLLRQSLSILLSAPSSFGMGPVKECSGGEYNRK